MKKKNKILCMGMILSLAALQLSAQGYITNPGTTNRNWNINATGTEPFSDLIFHTNVSGENFRIRGGNDTIPKLHFWINKSGSWTDVGSIRPNTFLTGNALLGTNTNDNPIFQHRNLSTTGDNYAITQNSSGLTVVNAAAGEEIQFSIGGVGQAKFDNGHFEIIGGNGIRVTTPHNGLQLPNSETDRVGNPGEGLVIYDRNFYPISQSGAYDGNTGAYDEGVGYFTTDGGGLQVYNLDDGWSSLIDTKNMDNLNATFNEVSINDDLHVEDNAVIGSELVIGTTIDELVAGTVLTVDGAVHISPADVAPTPFSINDYLADYLLWVEKGVVSIDYAISDPQAWDGVPDYVFEEDYKLSSLEKLKSYVKKHKHLPGIPGVDELKEKNHYQVHDMLMGQLKNIEELTLHTIEQEEKIEELERRLDRLEKLITQ